MEHLQKCFLKSTNWNEDNIFSNITATSQALLDFPIPNGFKIDTSSKTTDFSASSFTLSNFHQINGSIAYLYSSKPLTNIMGTKEISLQDAIAGFRMIEPLMVLRNQKVQESNLKKRRWHNTEKSNKKHSLLYGRMYFPGSTLEAMIIKRITENTQLLIKCVNNPHLDKNGTMIVYLQNNTAKYSRELIYSTNESLIGLRCLYNLGNSIAKNKNPNLIPKFDNSVVSVGTELWFAARTMSPGLSSALRYSTRSTATGKPLTMTLAVNPILGHISSTYTVKTSVASTFCSKYDFNFFSYASNLSLGFELYSYARKNAAGNAISSLSRSNHYAFAPQHIKKGKSLEEGQHPVQVKLYKPYSSINNDARETNVYNDRFPSKVPAVIEKRSEDLNLRTNETVTTAFQNLVNESDFSSVLKVSTSLRDKTVKLLWEGRVQDFLVSTGVRISLNSLTNTPELNKFGITFSYAF
ncbi:MDM10 [Candida oxycetoniae]|uniref:Mitochondrial distribution and morphology protein 10 n=1 Tax=Candida oxycetoniae TaxID=497107 RepID=A0AAI9WZA6_9ASCO|nr:MDM10 [Candida oxycetoniae]KAI3405710.2 MDM10 [Candida oxycetoniae]